MSEAKLYFNSKGHSFNTSQIPFFDEPRRQGEGAGAWQIWGRILHVLLTHTQPWGTYKITPSLSSFTAKYAVGRIKLGNISTGPKNTKFLDAGSPSKISASW